MKKKLIVLLVVGVMMLGSLMEVFAKTGENGKDSSKAETKVKVETEDKSDTKEKSENEDLNEYLLKECDWIEVDSEGNVIATSEDKVTARYSINGSVIGSGNTKYYYPSGDSAGFNVKANVPVTVSLSLNKAVTLRVFLTNGSSSTIYGKNPGAVVYPYASQKMRVGIENMTSESVTVNGTITW